MKDDRVIVRRGYVLIVNEDADGNYIKFEVQSRSFTVRKYINVAMLILLCSLLHRNMNRISHLLRLPQEYHTHFQVISMVLCCLVFKDKTVDSLSIIKNYGIQTTKIGGLSILPYGVNKALFTQHEFIPRYTVVDLVINEGFFKGFQVVFYLAVIIRDINELKLLFMSNPIKLDDQRLIYQMSRNYLCEEGNGSE
ncbi:hypothetical protein KAFR_0H03360 [Kazachstania africana CBS 2517]|uniref:Phosphatidylinositol N-acetylglucosaminyltransferase subunit H conserved domain-containing protein n=1 Tax=Kazachstania africana (strain ATCC 22294 / BCRC 22015 / CBS 2517 / CECT 1963 / NBRC 1671 / NRRL Y-8276) TaxID=1071382 RepID=H2AZJ0_KAZAF|nr:hypothetical protein KAFR_0H03360 [Kazachstania africana CBS 2517]CCF59746.1 hypothetical protein KAFR_0H03360 [Kazachstania africana CBS 2517]